MRVLRITLCAALLFMACTATALAAELEFCGLRIGMTEEEGKEAALKQGLTVGSLGGQLDENTILQYYKGTLFGEKDSVLNCYYKNGKLSAITVTKTTMFSSSDPKNIAAMGKKLLADWGKQYGTKAPVYTVEPGLAGTTQHLWNLPDNRLIRLSVNEDYTELDLFVGIKGR